MSLLSKYLWILFFLSWPVYEEYQVAQLQSRMPLGGGKGGEGGRIAQTLGNIAQKQTELRTKLTCHLLHLTYIFLILLRLLSPLLVYNLYYSCKNICLLYWQKGQYLIQFFNPCNAWFSITFIQLPNTVWHIIGMWEPVKTCFSKSKEFKCHHKTDLNKSSFSKWLHKSSPLSVPTSVKFPVIISMSDNISHCTFLTYLSPIPKQIFYSRYPGIPTDCYSHPSTILIPVDFYPNWGDFCSFPNPTHNSEPSFGPPHL